MYCAKPIDVQQVLYAQEDTDSYRALLHTAKELMKDDVVAYKANIQAVNNHGYPEAFQVYVEKLAPALRAFCVAAEASTAQRAAEEYSLFLMERFLELFQKLQVKENDTPFFDYRYTVVAFLIPRFWSRGTRRRRPWPINSWKNGISSIPKSRWERRATMRSAMDSVNGFALSPRLSANSRERRTIATSSPPSANSGTIGLRRRRGESGRFRNITYTRQCWCKN